MPRKFGALTSSVDPTQISLTVESVGKVLIGIVAYFLVSKGMDAATASNSLQQIIDLIAAGVPLVFTLWHSCMMAWGIVRKLIVAFTKPTPPAIMIVPTSLPSSSQTTILTTTPSTTATAQQ